jgi:hypothetical protein
VGKPDRKIPLGRPRRRWEENNYMDIQELGYGVMNWISILNYMCPLKSVY